MYHIMQYGVWKTLAVVQQYLSLFVLPSPAAYVFFGWMIPEGPPPPPPTP
jgi:hypothetical protein